MKSKNAIIVLGLVVLLLAGSIVMFISYSGIQDDDGIEIVTLTHDKGWLPRYNENFTRQGEKALAEIGIGIRSIPSATTDLYIHQMKATLPTDQAPDLFTWWSTFRVKDLVDRNLVGDLTDLWEKHRDEYSVGIRDAFTIDGRQYGFPYGIDYWPVWYNRRIFKRLGLKEPATWHEFIRVCETLKAAGVTPLIASLQFKWPTFIWFEEMIIGESPDLYEKLCLGKAKFTDPGVRKAFAVWRDMIRKGYFTDPSANMLSNGGHLWQKEEFGMVLCGTWYYANVLLAHGVDPDNIGAFILPSHNPKAGKNIIFEVGPIYTAKNARNARAAKKLADWWMGKEGSSYFARIHQTYPGNATVDTSFLPPVKEKLAAAIKREKYRVLNRYWEATPTEICTAAVEKFGDFMLNPDALDEILVDLQTIADRYWTKKR